MKIVQFMASEKWGGAEKVFVDVSNELSRRHQVIVLVLRSTEYKSRFSKRVEIIELHSHPTTHNPFLVVELYAILKKRSPDIVHTHAAKASMLIRRVGYFLELRHLATKHNSRKGRIFNRLKWVSSVSSEGRRSVKARKGAVVKVIYNGIQPRKVSGSVENSVFRIAAIGRLDAIKGFDILIEQLQEISFPFELLIAGEGPESGNLRRKVDQLNMQDAVRLAGFCDDIPTLMKQSHMIVISSYSEGFPQVMVESLFYGNVLISTPVGGVKEVLPSLFMAEQGELGRKIEDVYENYSNYQAQFSKLREERSNDFLIEKIGKDYEAYYTEILQ
jgi:glycosyltransferase involved in cell wall biosynthesis